MAQVRLVDQDERLAFGKCAVKLAQAVLREEIAFGKKYENSLRLLNISLQVIGVIEIVYVEEYLYARKQKPARNVTRRKTHMQWEMEGRHAGVSISAQPAYCSWRLMTAT